MLLIKVSMRIEPLNIDHKEVLVSRLKKLNAGLSEYTFPNLYLFRSNHDYQVIFDNEELFIRGRTYDGFTYLMPTVEPAGIDPGHLKKMLLDADFLFPIPEAWLAPFNPEEFEVTFQNGDADYIYTVEKMSTYRGRDLHKKRNLLKQFLEMHSHEARPLTNDRLDDARFILEDWLMTSKSKPEETDYTPAREALDRYEELVLCGGIYYADNEPAGFVIGEELNPETFVLHFAKARTKFKGVYQYIYNTFARVLPSSYRYLNLEQDLDRENMRIFKSSYAPAALYRKGRVRLKI